MKKLNFNCTLLLIALLVIISCSDTIECEHKICNSLNEKQIYDKHISKPILIISEYGCGSCFKGMLQRVHDKKLYDKYFIVIGKQRKFATPKLKQLEDLKIENIIVADDKKLAYLTKRNSQLMLIKFEGEIEKYIPLNYPDDIKDL